MKTVDEPNVMNEELEGLKKMLSEFISCRFKVDEVTFHDLTCRASHSVFSSENYKGKNVFDF